MIKALGGFLAAKYREFIGLQVFNVMWLDGPTAERRHRGNDNTFGTVRLRCYVFWDFKSKNGPTRERIGPANIRRC